MTDVVAISNLADQTGSAIVTRAKAEAERQKESAWAPPMQNEIWRPIVGYEDLYEVSNLGRVRSLDRENLCPNGVYVRRGRILRQRKRRRGGFGGGRSYDINSQTTRVNLSADGKLRTFVVCKLVRDHFGGAQ